MGEISEVERLNLRTSFSSMKQWVEPESTKELKTMLLHGTGCETDTWFFSDLEDDEGEGDEDAVEVELEIETGGGTFGEEETGDETELGT